MRLSLGRRRFLIGAAAVLSSPAAAVAAPRQKATAMPVTTVHQTGNRGLVPLAAAAGSVFWAGEASLGAWAIAESAVRWQRRAEDTSQFRPRVAGGVVVTGGAGFLAGWDAGNGRPLWLRRPDIQFGTPVLAGDRLYCGDGHRIRALRTSDGEPLWSFATTPDTLVSYAPAVAGEVVLCGPGDGRLYAVSAVDGGLLWRVDRSAEWQYLRQLWLHGDILVAGSYQEKLYGIATATGEVLWNFYAGNFINSHHVADGVAYLWSPTGWIFAIGAESGVQRWRHRTTAYRGGSDEWAPLMAELASSGGRLLALDMESVLHVLDCGSGREVSRQRAPLAVRPFVLPLPDGKVMLGGTDGSLLTASLA